MKIIGGVKWGTALFAVASLCEYASIVDGRKPKISMIYYEQNITRRAI
jgi:hypothetical protein